MKDIQSVKEQLAETLFHRIPANDGNSVVCARWYEGEQVAGIRVRLSETAPLD